MFKTKRLDYCLSYFLMLTLAIVADGHFSVMVTRYSIKA
jgi:hypothetical protein